MRTYGRRTFLAVTGIGLSSLLWAKPVWQRVSGVAQPLQSALPSGQIRSSGWRIYTVAATMPGSTGRRGGCGRRAGRSAAGVDLRAAARLPRAEQISDFHCVTGWSVTERALGRRAVPRLLAAARPRPEARRAASSPRRRSLRRHADARPGDACRRDARLRDGRQADPARARCAGPGRDPRDVRLQEREMGGADRPRASSSSRGTGSSVATTPMRGSAARTAS